MALPLDRALQAAWYPRFCRTRRVGLSIVETTTVGFATRAQVSETWALPGPGEYPIVLETSNLAASGLVDELVTWPRQPYKNAET